MKRILWVSRLGYSCSYAYVSNTLLHNLSGFDLYVFCTGIVHTEDDRKRIAKELKIPLDHVFTITERLPSSKCSEDHEYFNSYFGGVHHLSSIVEKVKPNLIVSIDDNQCVNRQWQKLRTKKWPFEFKFVPYVTVDCDDIDPDFLDAPAEVFTMTQFAKTQLLRYHPNKEITVLPHLIDPNVFFPLPQNQCRLKWMGRPDRFIVGAFNANNNRKRWDLLLEAFCGWARNHNDAVLLMKTPYLKPRNDFSLSPCSEYDFTELITSVALKYGIDLSRIRVIDGEVKSSDLNELYNCCDIGLNTTSGEGWGLTPCEMALIGIPTILPKFSSFPEIFGESECMMPCIKQSNHVGRNLRVSPDSLRDQFTPIAKSYSYHQTREEKVDILAPTEHVPTICISENGLDEGNGNLNYPLRASLDVIGHFRTIKFTCKFIQTYQFKDRFQILIGLNRGFLEKEQIDLEKLFKILPTEGRVNYLLREETLQRYWSTRFGSVELPSIETIHEYLEKFYQSSELRQKEGHYMQKRIREICDPTKIRTELKGLLERF